MKVKSACLALGLLAVWPAIVGAQCTDTGYFRDGRQMTALLVNPTTTVTGVVDATGCDIGVFYDEGMGATRGLVSNATIYRASYFGVAVIGQSDQVAVDVMDSRVGLIGEIPFNGAQHGVGIYYFGTEDGAVSGNVEGNLVFAYQKGGITANGANATVNIVRNTVTGLGPVSFIAQNGIQYGRGASGTVTDNEVSGNFYTGTVAAGTTPGGQTPPGWVYTSAGLLLYQAGSVKQSNNRYAFNQLNVSMAR